MVEGEDRSVNYAECMNEGWSSEEAALAVFDRNGADCPLFQLDEGLVALDQLALTIPEDE